MSDTADRLEDRLARDVGDAIDRAARPQSVPVNMYEAEEALVIVAPLPGVMADDVEVTIEPPYVQINAAMRTAAPKEYLLHEWHYGPYGRTVEIPAGYGSAASATFGNGQLAVRVERGRSQVGIPSAG